jgi:hypothetical protein
MSYLYALCLAFRCVANGEPAPEYKWFINGVKLEGETVKEL